MMLRNASNGIMGIRILFFLLVSAIFFSGCSLRSPGGEHPPIEPVVPEDSSSGLLSYYGNITAGREINDLVVPPGGEEVLVAPQGNKVYLLHQDGRILWEKTLQGEAFMLESASTSKAFALATREGKVVFFDEEKQVTGERVLDREIVDFALSEDGRQTALLTLPSEDGALGSDALLHLLDNRGFSLWEKPVTIDLDAPQNLHLSREGEGMVFIGRNDDGRPGLVFYDLKGQLLWQKEGYTGVSMSSEGHVVAAIAGPLVTVYDQQGNRKWGYDNTDVNLSHVLVSPDGSTVLTYSSYSTGQDNLFYFSTHGERPPWKLRVPAQSEIAVSALGEEVVVTTWQHYLEEFTLVSVIDTKGQEINALQVAGRGKKTALSPDGSVMVLSSDDGSIFFLDVRGGNMMGQPQGKEAPRYRPAVEANAGEYTTLYFYNDQASALIPVSRKIDPTDLRLERAVEELIKGPRLGSGLSRTIPRDAAIQVERRENTIIIDLPKELAFIGGSSQREGLVNSLMYTISHFPQASWIQFLVEGNLMEAGENGMDLSRPIPVRRPGLVPGRQVLYTPTLSGNRYYLNIREVSLRSSSRHELAQNLLEELIYTNRAFFPADLEVAGITFSVDSLKAQVNFSANISTLEPLLLDPDRSELLIDAVTYTLSENLSLNNVEILINGLRSERFPFLIREINRPFFVNPE